MGLLGAPGLSRVGPFLSQGLIRETFTRVKRTVLTQEYILPVNGHTCGEPPQRFFSGLVKKSLFSLAKSMFLGSEPFRGRLSLGFEAATKQQPVSSQQQPANSPAAAGQQPAASHSTSSPPPGRQQPANKEQPAYSHVRPQHVLIFPPESLPRTVKGSVQRGAAASNDSFMKRD